MCWSTSAQHTDRCAYVDEAAAGDGERTLARDADRAAVWLSDGIEAHRTIIIGNIFLIARAGTIIFTAAEASWKVESRMTAWAGPVRPLR